MIKKAVFIFCLVLFWLVGVTFVNAYISNLGSDARDIVRGWKEGSVGLQEVLVYLNNLLDKEPVDLPSNELVESCYIGLEITESLRGFEFDNQRDIISDNIDFELLNQSNLYGNYNSSVNYYNPEMQGDYELTTYDSSNEIISKYSVYSGRFVFYDNFDETSGEVSGGILELNSSTLYEIIPYDSRIKLVKINYNGTITDLNVDESGFKCERTCKIAGEVLGESDSCCIGFVAGENSNGDFVCVSPNDGVCSEFEDADSCIGDCYDSSKCLSEGCMNFSCLGDDYIKNESSCECDLKPLCDASDFNGDNKVDYTDLQILMASSNDGLASCKTTHGDSCCYAYASADTYISLKNKFGYVGGSLCRRGPAPLPC